MNTKSLLTKTAVIDICGEMQTGIEAMSVALILNKNLPRKERGSIDWHEVSYILSDLQSSGFLKRVWPSKDGLCTYEVA